ncbi:TPA: tripartite tricarboxylate transporter permease [Pasteurella multocida]|nr:tripartite tricarboxylate transporter permease [Pasteurella multocida]
MFDQIIAGFNEFFTWGSFLYINLGLFLGIVFGSIQGLTVMLCLVLFLPITYSLNAIHSFMFLLGIYCAGSYGGSISAILIKTPGTPHAAATMLDGNPLANRGMAQKALNVALYASFVGGIVSALVLLFLAPEVAKVALKMGSPEYFLICAFGLTIIAYLMDKLGFSAVPTLLGLVLSALTEKNLRRALLISDGDWTLFLERPFSLAFCILILVTIMSIEYVLNYVKNSVSIC